MGFWDIIEEGMVLNSKGAERLRKRVLKIKYKNLYTGTCRQMHVAKYLGPQPSEGM